MSKTLGRVLGPLGLLLLFFGAFTLVFLTGEMNWLVALQFGLGLGGIIFWGITAFEDARRLATGRGTVFVVTSAVTVVALIGVLVGGNYWVSRKHVEFDLTKNKLHTLSDETKALLKGLTPDDKVHVVAFFRPITDQEYGAAEDLLRRFKNYGGDNFDYEFVDYQKDPQRAKALGATNGSARIFFKSANGKESRAKEPTEEAMTNALAELTRGAEKKVYFLTGHGEKGVTKGSDKERFGLDMWKEGLLNEGYKTDELNLLAHKELPPDAQVIVVAGPQAPLQQGEIDAIKRFTEDGGRLVVMEDPGFDSGLEPLLASWGVEYLHGIVIDPTSQAPILALAQDFSDHPIAQPRRTLFGTLADLFPEARGIKKTSSVNGYDVTELFKTGPEAWGENTPLNPNEPEQHVTKDEKDDPGPITLAVAVKHKGEGEKEMRAVVFGDSDWMTNGFIGQGGNRDLALNTIQWLAGQESKITIRPKTRERSTISNFNANERLMLSFVSLQLLPLVLIAFGMSIWVVRRSK